jgi:ABC-type polysaccharide/polyol phosphate transport system ATPase subunit
MDRAVARLFPRWWAARTFQALRDVSFGVEEGSAVSIVGHNGAGKTTLLKVVAGVMAPTEGWVRVERRLAALIDVLVGFHPDLTGRENVAMLGAIHGFSRKEMGRRMDRILDFAEIDELADTPLSRYSAGMGARLAFGTLTALDVEILLVDEVLAVGDARFQRKCIGWLDEFRNRGGTLLFVSHNLGLVRNMTDRTIWIDHGAVVEDGPTRQVVARYAQAMEQRDGDPQARGRGAIRKQMRQRGMHRWGAGGIRVEAVHVNESAEDRSLDVSIVYEAAEVEEAVFCVGFLDESGNDLGAAASDPVKLDGERGSVRCTIVPVPLRPGVYFPVVAVLAPDGLVRDRWRLDRAVVLDGAGEVEGVEEFGPMAIQAVWTGPEERT